MWRALSFGSFDRSNSLCCCRVLKVDPVHELSEVPDVFAKVNTLGFSRRSMCLPVCCVRNGFGTLGSSCCRVTDCLCVFVFGFCLFSQSLE